MEKMINKYWTGVMAVVGVSLLGYAFGTPGNQLLETFAGTVLFTTAWMLRT